MALHPISSACKAEHGLAITNKTATFAQKANMNQDLTRFVKYGAVGVLNTAVTYISFVVLRALGMGLDLSNLASYALGMCNSFVLNKLWVFRRRNTRWTAEGLNFLAGAWICWGIQWLVFRAALLWVSEYWAQLVGMAAYTVFNYLYNRLVTFRPRT